MIKTKLFNIKSHKLNKIAYIIKNQLYNSRHFSVTILIYAYLVSTWPLQLIKKCEVYFESIKKVR